jgi:hypothetical protein
MSDFENNAGEIENYPDKAEWELLKKERKVVDLRQMGITYEVIAKEVGYASASGAYHAYERALARYPRETFDKKRDLQEQRIERLLAGVWTKALRGDTAAIMTTIKLFERQAKLLGLDMPQRFENTVEIFEGGSEVDEQVRRFAYLIAQAENQQDSMGDGEPTLLGIEGEIESDSTENGMANLVDPLGSRLGQDEVRGGMDSVGSDPESENSMGDSSQDF